MLKHLEIFLLVLHTSEGTTYCTFLLFIVLLTEQHIADFIDFTKSEVKAIISSFEEMMTASYAIQEE
jgi:hypothetical protein